MSRTRASFTLMEMLVVIAVIGILAALMVPAFRGIRERARQAHCASNLRQLYVAIMNYTSGGRLPDAVSTNWWEPSRGNYWHRRGWVSWAAWTREGTDQEVQPIPSLLNTWGYDWKDTWVGRACITNGLAWRYIAGTNVYTNPDDPRFRRALEVYLCPTFAVQCTNRNPGPLRSYSMNNFLSYRRLNDRSIVHSQCIMLADDSVGDRIQFAPYRSKYDSGFDPDTNFPTRLTVDGVATNHGGKGNVIFVDGHVELL